MICTTMTSLIMPYVTMPFFNGFVSNNYDLEKSELFIKGSVSLTQKVEDHQSINDGKVTLMRKSNIFQ